MTLPQVPSASSKRTPCKHWSATRSECGSRRLARVRPCSAKRGAASPAHRVPNAGDGAHPERADQRQGPNDHRCRADNIRGNDRVDTAIRPRIDQGYTNENDRREDAIARHARRLARRHSRTPNFADVLGTRIVCHQRNASRPFGRRVPSGWSIDESWVHSRIVQDTLSTSFESASGAPAHAVSHNEFAALCRGGKGESPFTCDSRRHSSGCRSSALTSGSDVVDSRSEGSFGPSAASMADVSMPRNVDSPYQHGRRRKVGSHGAFFGGT